MYEILTSHSQFFMIVGTRRSLSLDIIFVKTNTIKQAPIE